MNENGSEADPSVQKSPSRYFMVGQSLIWICIPLFLAITIASGVFNGDDILDIVEHAADTILGDPEISRYSRRKTLTVTHARGVVVADFSQNSLPKIRVGARVIDLFNAQHFDDILMDSPTEIRPSSVVLFYDSQSRVCLEKFIDLNWDHTAETLLPPREKLFIARYDMYAAPRRAWYKWVPELDLKKRLQVTSCPELVFIPRSCDGFVDWCVREEKDGIKFMGCEDFKTNCSGYVSWDGKTNMTKWLHKRIKDDEPPKISPFLGSYSEQGRWIRQRDISTTENHLRNIYLSQAFPAFTETGFKAMPTPEPVQKWLLDFVEAQKKRPIKTERWESTSTQMSFVEVPTRFYDLDAVSSKRNWIANKYIKPLVEQWSGIKPLKLTSFYGVREYPDRSFLRNHVDKTETHILSVTICVAKEDANMSVANPWPLEVLQWTGDHVRYDHPEGTMIFYESSKLPHGRPYRNKGGPHFGAFVHFKPEEIELPLMGKPEKFIDYAIKNQKFNTQRSKYRSTKSVEPEVPAYSNTNYGEGSQWKKNSNDDDVNNFKSTVKIFNKCGRPLSLFWRGHEGIPVFVSVVAPETPKSINTFLGHNFFFTEENSDKELLGSTIEMKKNQNEYSYSC